MAFDPLGTDEKIETDDPNRDSGNRSRNPGKDMDSQMLFGCSGFLSSSLGGYFLSVWPFFVFQTTDRLATICLSIGLGILPTAILTGVLSRKFGIAGTCGAIGGAIATAMFLYLRLQQAFLAYMSRQAPEPQYPTSMEYLIPFAFLLTIALVGVACMNSSIPD